MKKIEFEFVDFTINPDREGQYIVIMHDGSYDVLFFVTMYGELGWRDYDDNKIILKPKFWLKKIE